MASTTISNVRVFVGEHALENQTVTIEETRIASVRPSSTDDEAHTATGVPIDGTGKTLLPGLIDAHTHSSRDALRLALQFGVTTELEIGWRPRGSDERTSRPTTNSLTSGPRVSGSTPPGGHPFEIIREVRSPARGNQGSATS